MDALMITTDTELLREGSAAETNIKTYADLGKHIMIFVLHADTREWAARRIGPTMWIVPVYGPVTLLAAIKAVRVARDELFFQRTFQVDVIDAHDALTAAFAGLLIARKFHRPLHVQMLGGGSVPLSVKGAPLRILRSVFSRFFLAHADSVSTDSEDIRNSLLHTAPDWKDRVFLQPRVSPAVLEKVPDPEQGNSVDLRSKYPQFKIILLTVAPYTAEYNLELAIYTLAGVIANYPFAGLVMVGEGSQKSRLSSLAKKLGVLEHVVFEPPGSESSSYYKGAHIFLVTAPRREYGNTIAEAAAASCAILSTNVGLAADFLKDGESAYICKANDPSCFVKVATMLITQPAVRERVRLNGMLALENFVAQSKSEPEARGGTRTDAWEAAAAHFKSTQKRTMLPPKAARESGARPSH